MTLEEVLKDAGIKVFNYGEHHHARRGWVQMDCPYCGQNTGRYHLGLNKSGNYFNCYKCGKLNTVEVLASLLGVSVNRSAQILCSTVRQKADYKPSYAQIRGKLTLPVNLQPLGAKHREYLKKRGFRANDLVTTWQIQALVGPPMSHRIFIPIFAKNGEMVSWTSRSIDPDAELRYISAKSNQEIYNHKTLLYGEHLCEDTIVVCEGPVSAWAIGPGAVATCGLGFTRPQLIKMAKYPRRYICFDAEPAAQRRARRLCNSLAPFPGFTKNILLDRKDPAELSSADRKKLRNLIFNEN